MIGNKEKEKLPPPFNIAGILGLGAFSRDLGEKLRHQSSRFV